MSDDLTLLEEWVAPLLEKMAPAERRKLAATIGRDLRRSQQQRIARQQNPDGSVFSPRKLQEKAGRIKRLAMFQKIRQNRHLKLRTDANSLSVGFFGRVARVARVHQYGLRDRVRPGGKEVRYEQRELLGFSGADIDTLRGALIDHFGAR